MNMKAPQPIPEGIKKPPPPPPPPPKRFLSEDVITKRSFLYFLRRVRKAMGTIK